MRVGLIQSGEGLTRTKGLAKRDTCCLTVSWKAAFSHPQAWAATWALLGREFTVSALLGLRPGDSGCLGTRGPPRSTACRTQVSGLLRLRNCVSQVVTIIPSLQTGRWRGTDTSHRFCGSGNPEQGNALPANSHTSRRPRWQRSPDPVWPRDSGQRQDPNPGLLAPKLQPRSLLAACPEPHADGRGPHGWRDHRRCWKGARRPLNPRARHN